MHSAAGRQLAGAGSTQGKTASWQYMATRQHPAAATLPSPPPRPVLRTMWSGVGARLSWR